MATTFSCRDIHRFMTPLFHIALNSDDIQNCHPCALIYGLLHSCDLGIWDPFWSQLIQHV